MDSVDSIVLFAVVSVHKGLIVNVTSVLKYPHSLWNQIDNYEFDYENPADNCGLPCGFWNSVFWQ